ncbi:hypothetical protein YPPY103_2305, partial [Yersinia pestis PY-103]
MIGFWAIDKNL